MARNKEILKNERFFSTTELAEALGVSRIAVFKKIQSGSIRAEKIGRNYIISSEEFAAVLGLFVSEKRRKEIDKSIERTVKEYGEALRRLGKE
ncbi:MAG: excisionase family DNA-binding protein [Candidatus Levyibacteriota bacterium]